MKLIKQGIFIFIVFLLGIPVGKSIKESKQFYDSPSVIETGNPLHTRPVSQGETPVLLSPPPLPQDLEHASKWIFYNQQYEKSDKRTFRFMYPSYFEIADIDSGKVWLKKGTDYYLGLEETYPLTKFPKGNTRDEKFVEYYFDKKRIWNNQPPLVFDLVSIDTHRFFYTTTETKSEKNDDATPFYSTTRNFYAGEVQGHGVEMIELISLPNDVISKLLRSIEFAI